MNALANMTKTGWPPGLKSLQEAAESIHIQPQRLQAFAEAGDCPSVRMPNGEYKFQLTPLKQWAADNLIQVQSGRKIAFKFQVVQLLSDVISDEPPLSIRHCEGLYQLPLVEFISGVYFLVRDKKVVYVGQSTAIMGRLATHRKTKDFDSVYFIPVPKEQLDEVEGAFIRHLRPPLNLHRVGNDQEYIAAPRKQRDVDDAEVIRRYIKPDKKLKLVLKQKSVHRS